MDFKYDVINYEKTIPAKITRRFFNSDTRKTELQWHREPELVYVIEGDSECLCNGESQFIRQGDFVLFNSEDVHLVRASEGNTCNLLCVNFSFEYIRQFCKSIESVFFDLNGHEKVRDEVALCLRKIAETDAVNDDYSALMQIVYINRIYYLLLRHCLSFRRSPGTVALPKKDFSG